MMLIPTYLAESPIPGAGLGIFCKDAVAAGTVVWRFTPGLDLVLTELPPDPVMRAFVEKYGYCPHDRPGTWIVCLDNARFFNHAPRGQATCISDPANPDIDTIAVRDLAPGTELTDDYTEFCAEPFLNWNGDASLRHP